MGCHCTWFAGIVYLLVHWHITIWGFMLEHQPRIERVSHPFYDIRRFREGVQHDASGKAMRLWHSAENRDFLPTEEELSLGAPRFGSKNQLFTTKGGICVESTVETLQDPNKEVEKLIKQLDSWMGVLLHSSYDFTARYSRWTVGFVNPPIVLTGKGNEFKVTALNSRGRVLLPAFLRALTELKCDEKGFMSVALDEVAGVISGDITHDSNVVFIESDRSRQLSQFSIIRRIVKLFSCNDPQMGLYGAFGYDLGMQFEAIKHHHKRDPDQNDLVLYLPDSITVVDQDKGDARVVNYDFSFNGKTTRGLPRSGDQAPFEIYSAVNREAAGATKLQHAPPKGQYSEQVTKAREEFRVGNLFEVVLSQTFKEPCNAPPSEIFRTLCRMNPSPYGFLINLGNLDYLVGASPEMFVRCEKTREGFRVETCPISGTIPRGSDAMTDAAAIRLLLSSTKEESELTMCTDVDRNDKSRVCLPGTVKILNRRQIEMYSRVIHTVDHVEGYLKPEFDALDAFLCHTWAVTVTGAPKRWAMQYIEQHESNPRAWYGGAVGHVGFDGYLNTGLTLRTVHIKRGIAEVRTGATLLYDSVPADEESETEIKASAMLDAVKQSNIQKNGEKFQEDSFKTTGHGKHVLLIDHEDSFVHTLGNYVKQTGANITTVRCGPALDQIFDDMMKGKCKKFDLVVLSPGPGCPSDFNLTETLSMLERLRLPAFGVCLGLQGMVEHWGGKLGVLQYPQHGKKSEVLVLNRDMHKRGIFNLIPDAFEVARYHSLYSTVEWLPEQLQPMAITSDGVIMAVEHKTLPFAGVQFHPESILTYHKHGLALLSNCLTSLKYGS